MVALREKLDGEHKCQLLVELSSQYQLSVCIAGSS